MKIDLIEIIKALKFTRLGRLLCAGRIKRLLMGLLACLELGFGLHHAGRWDCTWDCKKNHRQADCGIARKWAIPSNQIGSDPAFDWHQSLHHPTGGDVSNPLESRLARNWARRWSSFGIKPGQSKTGSGRVHFALIPRTTDQVRIYASVSLNTPLL